MNTFRVYSLFSATFVAASLIVLLSGSMSVYAQAPDRSKPPALENAPSLKLPTMQHLSLSNGLPVVLMEKHELPLVQIDLLVMAGASMDPREKRGLASLASAMMEEGAGERDALMLADAIDFLGASITPFTGRHTSGLSLHTQASKLDSALSLFADMALRPTFPSVELERHRKELLTSLVQWHDDPGTIASVLTIHELFGEEHPYGFPPVGSEQTIRALRVEDLKRFHATYYRPNNATLLVVGDISANALLPKLEALFGNWKRGEIPRQQWPEATQVQKKRLILVDKPDAAQSVLRVARIGAPRSTEDYFPLLVMNTILGGSFTSRLNQNLREQHGYAYGANSSFDFRILSGPFIVSTSVQTDVTDKALAEVMKELTNILKSVTDDEVNRARNYLALGYPAGFESVAGLADQLGDLVVYNLPDSYFNDYTKKVLAVTREDILRVAHTYVDPEKVNIVVVGDRKKVEEGVKALNLAPIEYRTIDEVLGKAPVIE